MEDGLFQLLFILMIIIASVVDAVSRSRKKRGRIEDMEREEAEASETGGPHEYDEEYHEEVSAEFEHADTEEGGEREGAGETADRMVPADLWAILTGQPPPETAPPPGPRPPAGEGPKESPPEVPPKPEPDYRRPASTIRGPSAPGRAEPEWTSPPIGAKHGSASRGRRPVPPKAAELEAVFGTLQEPWGDLPDISEGEISDDGELQLHPDSEEGSRAAVARSRPRGGRYTELLGSGDRNDLKKAIVLREVLGPPAGLRRSEDLWDEGR